MTTIILTTTVHIHDNIKLIYQVDPTTRINTYLKSILQWLNNTQFNIVLVENSGYNFHELDEEKEKFKDRFEVIVFDDSKLSDTEFIRNSNSKGRHEIFAINYAFNHSKLLKTSNFIIKITGRFFIPEFEEYLKKYNLNKYDCLVQNDRDRCEVVGSHYNNFLDIFNIYIDQDHIENVWKSRTSSYTNILLCKIFTIDETQRGTVNETYTTI
jgi:hypothetical protein